MSDFVSLVIGLPAVVEGVVKTCRTFQRYKDIEAEHTRLIDRAVFGSKKLVFYASFVDTNEYAEVQEVDSDEKADSYKKEVAIRRALLEEALLHANDALIRVAGVVEEWTIRLGLGKVEVDGRLFMMKIASLLSTKLRKSKKNIDGSHSAPSGAKKKYVEAAYLATGSLQIEEALVAMERWTLQFKDILLTSPTIRLVRDPDSFRNLDLESVADEVLFISQANEREEKQTPVHRIPGDSIGSIVDIDPKRPTGIFVIESGNFQRCLVDRRNIDHLLRYGKEDQAIRDTDRIARIFAEDSTNKTESTTLAIGVLQCRGWAESATDTAMKVHDLIFRLPENSRSPRTLRMLLLAGPPRHSLNDRIDFCIRLSTSILIMHSLNLVHKDIRPDSVLVIDSHTSMKNGTHSKRLGEPYLGNFNHTRSEVSDTVQNPFQYSPLMRTLYVHPLHTTSVDHKRYRMRDDIYSLGVCLLEIARWRSFFVWDDYRQCYDADTSTFDFSPEKYEKIFEDEGQPAYREAAWLIQMDLIELAETEVPIIMGDAFAEIIVACLCFGDRKKPTRKGAVKKIQGDDYVPQSESVTFFKDVLAKLRALKLD